ncbi:uncharacterized protein Z518_05947 [Rhinocladiella mackenziei CBS 650.93]|uniref:Rhinocladiella mackenziei CBS 650.93 unplaced genomic scaffold supercont1.4, whole genome shotgun sequence n=1 Tax=Rhinocladiella mackenziei CBS 650.93 TaxID=1442369 RepID=A0A0D2J7R4_9EURO|nr:uncharacterized protein Z518_05947 [Rhinocladiella mackenziei CBS 650.93]KIX05075.1 hypothetical protein Z518_05947 [Rhinocladiella mackenziei CBS 650.93]
MSSRALRKLQREQELQRQVAAAKTAYEETQESEDDDIPGHISTPSRPANAFDMLEDVGDEDEPDSKEREAIARPNAPTEPQAEDGSQSNQASSTKSKKRRKKGKKKGSVKHTQPTEEKDVSGDEVDRALRELAAKHGHRYPVLVEVEQTPSWEATATKLLAIDANNLNPVNEMKSLFGNIALEEHESRSAPRHQRRREQNLQGGVDLATALTGRYCVASKGKELGTLASRRNVFVQGKEEWPSATSGGLGMEYVPDPVSFEKTYNIIHNNLYQETQMHFQMAVESMNPQRMVGLLSMYPYHIATLLQVSEIAKHQGDHAVSGDLVERALFSFGKSVHSSFPAALRSGVARVPFDKPANRELYLAIWRYIKNLEMRGTWRTAFEWAKVLLQLNTQTDPYGVTLMVDQLALRGRQHAQLIALCSDDGYGQSWDFLPNIQISLALAYQRAGKLRESRTQLAVAMHKYPYILSALASALDISPLPKSLWAKLPSTDAEKLYTQLYVTRAKDLWNTPETISLLVEVAETLSHYSEAIAAAPAAPKLEVSLEEARHIMLLEIPSLIALLPRHFTTMPTSSSDILPPPDSQSGFVRRTPGNFGAGQGGTMQTIFNAAGATAGATGSLLQRVLNWFQTPARPDDVNDESEGEAALRNLQEQLGGDIPEDLLERLLQIHLDDAGNMDEGVTPAGLGIAGGWDYYEDAERNNSTADNDDDSIPELESISDDELPPAAPNVPRNPRAPMVEEDEEDEDLAQLPHLTAGRTVLRHVDSDSEDEGNGSTTRPTNPLQSAIHPTQADATTSVSASEDFSPSDPQRVQRWLLTTGLMDLRSKPETLDLYISRLKLLRSTQQEWVVRMVGQRAGADVESRVRGAIG